MKALASRSEIGPVTSLTPPLEWGSSHPRSGAVKAWPAEFLVFIALLDFRRRNRLRKGQRQRVSIVGRGLAALLHVRLAFQHQQVAPVDVIARTRQIRRHLFVGLDRAAQLANSSGPTYK